MGNIINATGEDGQPQRRAAGGGGGGNALLGPGLQKVKREVAATRRRGCLYCCSIVVHVGKDKDAHLRFGAAELHTSVHTYIAFRCCIDWSRWVIVLVSPLLA